MARNAAVLICVLLVSVLLAACGGDDPDPTVTPLPAAATVTPPAVADVETATPEPAATSTSQAVAPTAPPTATEPAATVEPTATSTVAPVATTAPVATATAEAVTADPTATETAPLPTSETDADAEEALLAMVVTEEELPEGWALFQVGPAVSESGGLTFCNAESFSRPGERLAAVEAEFERDPIVGPFLLQSLTAYPEETAIEAFEYSREITGSCEEWTDEDGLTYQLSVEDRPGYGDDSYGLRMTFDAPGAGQIIADFTLVRFGGILLALGHLGIDELDTEEFTDITGTVVARIEASDYRP
jgi:hypothetical protein